jgi:hypothetical protein
MVVLEAKNNQKIGHLGRAIHHPPSNKNGVYPFGHTPMIGFLDVQAVQLFQHSACSGGCGPGGKGLPFVINF